jgi:hypothetical protein
MYGKCVLLIRSAFDMTASLLHFCETVDRIRQNSWWKDNFDPAKPCLTGLTFSLTDKNQTITNVPTEALESLLVHVRKLTLGKAPENLLSVRRSLKTEATETTQRDLLDSWHKYWRLAFIKEPFFIELGGVKHVMTPYRAYDCFINGLLFHTNNPIHNLILHGSQHPAALSDPSLFLRNLFHSTVANFCLAACGLKFFVDNKDSGQWVLAGYPPVVFEYILYRKRIEELDEQYKVFSDWIEANGGCPEGRWGN